MAGVAAADLTVGGIILGIGRPHEPNLRLDDGT